jgi:hypothetical protein
MSRSITDTVEQARVRILVLANETMYAIADYRKMRQVALQRGLLLHLSAMPDVATVETGNGFVRITVKDPAGPLAASVPAEQADKKEGA